MYRSSSRRARARWSTGLLTPILAGAVAFTSLIPIVAGATAATASAEEAPAGYVPGLSTLVPWLTTTSGQTFQNPDGTRTLIASPGPVRFRDPHTGAWMPIDLTATAQADGSIGAAALLGGARLDASTGAITLATAFGPVVLSHSGAGASVGQLNGRTATWAGLFGDERSLVESFQTNGAEEAVVFPSVTDSPGWTDTITLPAGVSIRAGNGGVEFVDSGGAVIGGFGGGLATDAAHGEGKVTTELVSQAGQTATVRVSVDPAWLAAARAPVTVDPTLYSAGNEFTTYVNSDNCAGAYYYESELRVGNDGLYPDVCGIFDVKANNKRYARAYLRFYDVGNIAGIGASVTSATMRLNLFSEVQDFPPHFEEAYDLQVAPYTDTTFDHQPAPDFLTDTEAITGGLGWKNFNVTAAANRWVQGPNLNNGVGLWAASEQTDTFSLKKFYSVNAGSSVAPELTLTYMPGDATYMDSTGAALAPVDPNYLSDLSYSPPPNALAAKYGTLESIRAEVNWRLADLAAGEPVSDRSLDFACGANPCFADAGSVSQPLTREQTKYTCGPAASRIVLWQMNGTDPGEASLASEEHTSSVNGTTISSIAPVLNRHQTADFFITSAPEDIGDYMSHVVDDVNKYHHGLVNNVLTNQLSFWGGHRARHYDVSYGYDFYSVGHVGIAEEWDPTAFGIGLSGSGPSGYSGHNPYGYHTEPLSNVWAAVHTSPSQAIVW
jgi:hypothetical protein